MAETASASSRTKHIDVKYHYVREFVESGFIKIIYIATDENISDMFTKNVRKELYDKHSRRFVIKKEELMETRNEEQDLTQENVRKGVRKGSQDSTHSHESNYPMNELMNENSYNAKNSGYSVTDE